MLLKVRKWTVISSGKNYQNSLKRLWSLLRSCYCEKLELAQMLKKYQKVSTAQLNRRIISNNRATATVYQVCTTNDKTCSQMLKQTSRKCDWWKLQSSKSVCNQTQKQMNIYTKTARWQWQLICCCQFTAPLF